jgi:hypothetical protein
MRESYRTARKLLVLLISGLLEICMLPVNAAEQDPKQAEIRVEVEMVSLPVVVTTHSGARVADLQREDFQVFEDKIRRQIAGPVRANETGLRGRRRQKETELASLPDAAVIPWRCGCISIEI